MGENSGFKKYQYCYLFEKEKKLLHNFCKKCCLYVNADIGKPKP